VAARDKREGKKMNQSRLKKDVIPIVSLATGFGK
jgi:hypothetical protein